MNSEVVKILFLFLIPLISSIAILIAGSKKFARIIALSSAAFLVIFILYTTTSIQTIKWKWITIGERTIDFIFDFNPITITLSIVVTILSLLVNIYSVGYFKWDEKQPRYFATLSFFTISMIGLILSGNLLQTFIFWELVGVSSYLLIGFYREKTEAAIASSKALIMNKVGDIGFIVALMAIYTTTGSLDLNNFNSSHSNNLIVGIGIMIAAFSKSAQFPFQTWLPDAMEGPTPISALIHSATMVAAGVFLLIRVQALLPNEILIVIASTGAITAIIGGFNALKAQELKRLLAWSTVSQLGLMIMIVGLQGFETSFIHLISHAIFKSGLFLVAGILISQSSGWISEISATSKSILITLAVIILSLSLMGMPLTIGFLSKEILLSSINSTLFTVLFFIINLISILYSARILSLVIPIKKSASSTSFLMVLPVLFLSTASLWIFYSLSPISSDWINGTFQITYASFSMTALSIIWVLLWCAVSFYLIRKQKIHSWNWIPVIQFDSFLHLILIKPTLQLAKAVSWADDRIINKAVHGIAYTNLSLALILKWLDNNLIDGFVRFISILSKSIGNILRQFVAGKIQSYIWWTLVSVIILFIIAKS